MNYYVISDEDSRILCSYPYPPTQELLQGDADAFGVSVWVIVGDQNGMSAEPKRKEDDTEKLGEQLSINLDEVDVITSAVWNAEKQAFVRGKEAIEYRKDHPARYGD
jgi:hypothetical protein